MAGKPDPDQLKRQIRRLTLVISALLEANMFVQYLTERKLYRDHQGYLENPTVTRGLFVAAVVAYGRARKSSKTEGSFPTTSKARGLLKGLSAAEQDLDRRLIELRDKTIAHSDADVVEAKVGAIGDEGLDPGETVTDTTLPQIFGRDELRVVEKLTMKVWKNAERARAQLLELLP